MEIIIKIIDWIFIWIGCVVIAVVPIIIWDVIKRKVLKLGVKKDKGGSCACAVKQTSFGVGKKTVKKKRKSSKKQIIIKLD